MKKLLLLTVSILSAALSARITLEDIKKEEAEYKRIAQVASGLLEPMFVQAREEKAQIAAPINEAIAPLESEINAINSQKHVLYEEQGGLRERHRMVTRRLKEEQYLCLKAAIAPMEEELAGLRAPILERVAALRSERDAIENEHYRLKADPKWGRWMDGVESQNTAFRMAFKDEAIEKLYISVDGDLPAQITARKRAIEEEFRMRLEDDKKQYSNAMVSIESRIAELSPIECALSGRIRSLENQKLMMIDQAMPGMAKLMQEIQNQTVDALISGVMTPGSSCATLITADTE